MPKGWHKICSRPSGRLVALICVAMMAVCAPFNLFSVSLPFFKTSPADSIPASVAAELPDSINVSDIPDGEPMEVVAEPFVTIGDRMKFIPEDTIPVVTPAEAALLDSIAALPQDEWVRRDIEFNPDPTKAVWMAALFPGLGQLYNRRYWKLPIVVGGYLGLAYATSWNNTMLTDYTKAYADIMDNDPTTKSYMDFFPSHVKEEDLDKTWLTNILQSRKNYFRRNRDLCIIAMVGVYLVAMIDAYVDASLAHFDISPDLSMDVYPSLIQDGRNRWPSVGLQWAFNF